MKNKKQLKISLEFKVNSLDMNKQQTCLIKVQAVVKKAGKEDRCLKKWVLIVKN